MGIGFAQNIKRFLEEILQAIQPKATKTFFGELVENLNYICIMC
jgi:hypothetical protein